MTDRIEQFLNDSQAFVGQQAEDVPQGANLADWLTIRRFCAALGDPNPLYKDPASGVGTKYHSMIAPPTFVAAIRTPTAAAAYQTKDYGVTRITRHASIDLVDVIRVGDRLTSTLEVTGVSSGQPMNGKATANVECRVVYRNSYGGLIGYSSGTTALVPFRTGEEMICDREIYVYSDNEIANIQQGIEDEPPPRGRLLRYWEDAEVGRRASAACQRPAESLRHDGLDGGGTEDDAPRLAGLQRPEADARSGAHQSLHQLALLGRRSGIRGYSLLPRRRIRGPLQPGHARGVRRRDRW